MSSANWPKADEPARRRSLSLYVAEEHYSHISIINPEGEAWDVPHYEVVKRSDGSIDPDSLRIGGRLFRVVPG